MEDSFSPYCDILHLHCGDCYKISCPEQQNCKIVKCRYQCGASYHSCKKEDHEIVCFMMPRQCLNASYGCPYKISRCNIYKHLDVCPASAVECGMEWNRYPLYSKDRQKWIPFVESNPPKVKGQLDIELAFNDQKKLEALSFQKMKRANRRITKVQNKTRIAKERIILLEKLMGKKDSSMDKTKEANDFEIVNHLESSMDEITNSNCPDFEAACHSKSSWIDDDDISSFNNWNTYLMPLQNTKAEAMQNGEEPSACTPELLNENDAFKIDNRPSHANRPTVTLSNPSKSDEYDDFNGDDEANQRTDPMSDVNCDVLVNEVNDTDCSVITGDNETEAEPIEDPCNNDHPNSIEKEVKQNLDSKKNSESDDRIDGRGTTEEEPLFTAVAQYYNPTKFSAVIENGPTDHQITGFPKRYADIVSSPYFTHHLGLNVMIETIPKFQSSTPMYSIPCQTSLRRDQFCAHFKNVHADIHGGINGWIQQRCPLAQYGCPFIRHRLKPASKGGCLVFDQDIGGFAAKPEELKAESLDDFSLTSLPFDLLERILEFLDSFSIIQCSKTCKVLRDVCCGLVQRRGVVLLDWKRGTFADGTVSWKPYKQRWMFSPSFSCIKEWKFTDEPSLGEHMRKCPFYKRAIGSQKFMYSVNI